jgi:hypothetical protein
MMRTAIVAATALVLGAVSSGCSTIAPRSTNQPEFAPRTTQVDGPRNAPDQSRVPRTAADDARRQGDAIRAQFRAATEQCKRDLETATDLDPIRAKVELYRDDWDLAPPFTIAVLDTFPDEAERAAIAKFATLRDQCIRRSDAISAIPTGSSPSRRAFLQQDRAFFKDAYARVGDLIVALYQQKVTYAEFAQKRYEVTRNANAAERSFRQSAALQDEQRRVEAQRTAQRQAADDRIDWTAYIRAIDARAPHAVYFHCTDLHAGPASLCPPR